MWRRWSALHNVGGGDPLRVNYDDVIRWKHFPRCQWRGALMFSLICVSINGRVNNREAGNLRRYRTHYDVTVMYFTEKITHTSLIHDAAFTLVIIVSDDGLSLVLVQAIIWTNGDLRLGRIWGASYCGMPIETTKCSHLRPYVIWLSQWGLGEMGDILLIGFSYKFLLKYILCLVIKRPCEIVSRGRV